jgi:hypothetical protein
MWTVLDDGSRFFSRTLAEAGPLASMTGSSAERAFSLPFELGDGGPTPSSLEINLVTEGSGRFRISGVTVVADGGVGDTPTTVAEPALTTEAAATPTSTLQEPVTTGEASSGEASSTRLVLAVLVAAVGGSVIFIRANRRRRDAERRRMDVMDSMRS